MKSIRFDRGPQVPKLTAKLPTPPHLKEPLLKRILRLVIVFVLVFLVGYWILSNITFAEYRAIVKGDLTQILAPESALVKDWHLHKHQPFPGDFLLMELENPSLVSQATALDQEIEFLQQGARAAEQEGLAILRLQKTTAEGLLATAQAERNAARQKKENAENQVNRVVSLFRQGAYNAEHGGFPPERFPRSLGRAHDP